METAKFSKVDKSELVKHVLSLESTVVSHTLSSILKGDEVVVSDMFFGKNIQYACLNFRSNVCKGVKVISNEAIKSLYGGKLYIENHAASLVYHEDNVTTIGKIFPEGIFPFQLGIHEKMSQYGEILLV
jgi:hypothetical protein